MTANAFHNIAQIETSLCEAAQAAGTMPRCPLVKGDFIKRRALMLPEVGLRLGFEGDIPAANNFCDAKHRLQYAELGADSGLADWCAFTAGCGWGGLALG